MFKLESQRGRQEAKTFPSIIHPIKFHRTNFCRLQHELYVGLQRCFQGRYFSISAKLDCLIVPTEKTETVTSQRFTVQKSIGRHLAVRGFVTRQRSKICFPSQACSLEQTEELGFAMEPADSTTACYSFRYWYGSTVLAEIWPYQPYSYISQCRDLKPWRGWNSSYTQPLTDTCITWLFEHRVLFKWWRNLAIHHFATHVFKICTSSTTRLSSKNHSSIGI